MGNPNAEKLMAKASELVNRLQVQGIKANVIIDSLREYSIKVALPIGAAVIYYSLKKNTFKCQPENAKSEELWQKVLACWNDDEQLPRGGTREVQVGSSTIEIYVDGSFVNEITAYAAVAVQSNQILWEDSGVVPPAVVGGTRQVAGELMAVLKALEWCKAKEINEIIIHYDYQGIKSCVTREWQTKNDVTKRYLDIVQASGIQIVWQKVDAYTGVKWNEYVD